MSDTRNDEARLLEISPEPVTAEELERRKNPRHGFMHLIDGAWSCRCGCGTVKSREEFNPKELRMLEPNGDCGTCAICGKRSMIYNVDEDMSLCLDCAARAFPKGSTMNKLAEAMKENPPALPFTPPPPPVKRKPADGGWEGQ